MITIYTKPYCGYCYAAKSLLKKKDLAYEEIKVGRDPEKLQEMYTLSQRRTVPQIFFEEKHVGGYTDLVMYFREME